MKYNVKIILNDGTEIKSLEDFDSEDEAVNQCQQYAVNGYYSRSTKKYWVPTCIHHMAIEIE